MASNVTEMSEPVCVHREMRTNSNAVEGHSFGAHLAANGGPPPPEHSSTSDGNSGSPPSISHSTLDDVLFDSSSDTRSRSLPKDKKGIFSPRRAGALMNIFSASHRHKNSELHKIFTSLPESELLIDDYSCALQRDILIHGRLYLTQRWICFYANIFSWETLLTIPFQSVQAITKEKTALVIPNAIQVSTTSDKYGFSSLANRDMTYNIVFMCWQNVLLNQATSPVGLVQAARKARGESTNVGSGEDLWGKLKEEDGQSTKVMTQPTHLEIGLLPPTTLPLDEAQRRAEADMVTDSSSGSTALSSGTGIPTQTMSLPAGLGTTGPSPRAAVEVRGDILSQPATTPPDGASLHATSATATDYTENISIGGESIASSEYESVSLIEETGEITCGCSEHLGRTIVNDVYECDVETIFQLIFTDNEFIRNFFTEEKQYNIEMGEWQPNTDGSRVRDMMYTIDLNYSFGPKFCHTTEHQMYSKMGQPGLKHIVDADVMNHNIPYSDTFYVACRYCITRVAPKRARLRITANIKFKKSCWGLVKHLIERNAGDGVRSFYSHLDVALKEHIAVLPEKLKRGRRHGHGHGHRRSRRRQTVSPIKLKSPTPPQPPGVCVEPVINYPSPLGVTNNMSPPLSEVSTETISSKKEGEGSLSRINLALTLLLGILVASNVLLYQQLTGYSTVLTTPIDTPTSYAPDGNTENYQQRNTGNWPSSNQEWMTLIKEFNLKRGSEVENWQNEFSTAVIQELEQVEVAVNGAKKRLIAKLQQLGHDITLFDYVRSGDKGPKMDDKGDIKVNNAGNKLLTNADNKYTTGESSSKQDLLSKDRKEL